MKSELWFIHYLRIIAAFSIVLIHTAADLSFRFGQIPSSKWWAANLISSATHWAVPMFIMISGYLLLQPVKTSNYKKFYLNRIKRLGIPLLASILFYAVYYHFTRPDPLSFSFVVKRLIFDQPYEHLFFLIVLLQLALITPFLSKIINSLRKEQLSWLTFTFLFISVFWKPSRFIIPLFVPYLGYYLGGYWLKKKKVTLNKLFWMISLILILLMAIGTYALVIHSSPNRNGLYFYTYFNPLIILLSFSIFIFFQNREKRLPSKKIISQISNTTLGIYLIHPVVMDLFKFISFPNNFLLAFFTLLFKGSLVFISSALITAIYQRLKLAILRV